jgi:hypothetical protein
VIFKYIFIKNEYNEWLNIIIKITYILKRGADRYYVGEVTLTRPMEETLRQEKSVTQIVVTPHRSRWILIPARDQPVAWHWTLDPFFFKDKLVASPHVSERTRH